MDWTPLTSRWGPVLVLAWRQNPSNNAKTKKTHIWCHLGKALKHCFSNFPCHHWNTWEWHGNDCLTFWCPDPGAESHVNELSSPQQPSNPDAHASDFMVSWLDIGCRFSSFPLMPSGHPFQHPSQHPSTVHLCKPFKTDCHVVQNLEDFVKNSLEKTCHETTVHLRTHTTHRSEIMGL